MHSAVIPERPSSIGKFRGQVSLVKCLLLQNPGMVYGAMYLAAYAFTEFSGGYDMQERTGENRALGRTQGPRSCPFHALNALPCLSLERPSGRGSGRARAAERPRAQPAFLIVRHVMKIQAMWNKEIKDRVSELSEERRQFVSSKLEPMAGRLAK
jgi:hypothetical protein